MDGLLAIYFRSIGMRIVAPGLNARPEVSVGVAIGGAGVEVHV